jgi:hypothetical protein
MGTTCERSSRSVSVRIPTTRDGSPGSTTTTDPMCRSAIRAAASATAVEGATVTTGEDMIRSTGGGSAGVTCG